MSQVPRIIEAIDDLQKFRRSELIEIFSPVAQRRHNISVNNHSVRGSLIFGISDGKGVGQDFTNWRFKTSNQDVRASYHEIWNDLDRGKYYLERSYFHLYTLMEEEFDENEYVLLHCDASEPDDSPHSIYKQSPHLHIEVADHPIPKAHFALYNGRIKEVLKNRTTFNLALKDCVEMLNSQVLQAQF